MAAISHKVDLQQIPGSFVEGNVSLPFGSNAKVNLYWSRFQMTVENNNAIIATLSYWPKNLVVVFKLNQ